MRNNRLHSASVTFCSTGLKNASGVWRRRDLDGSQQSFMLQCHVIRKTFYLYFVTSSVFATYCREFLIYISCYTAVSLLYRLVLTGGHKAYFEKLCLQFGHYTDLVPISFVLGTSYIIIFCSSVPSIFWLRRSLLSATQWFSTFSLRREPNPDLRFCWRAALKL